LFKLELGLLAVKPKELSQLIAASIKSDCSRHRRISENEAPAALTPESKDILREAPFLDDLSFRDPTSA
jgi:hypothetical protein